jgi:hypothetical protein
MGVKISPYEASLIRQLDRIAMASANDVQSVKAFFGRMTEIQQAKQQKAEPA